MTIIKKQRRHRWRANTSPLEISGQWCEKCGVKRHHTPYAQGSSWIYVFKDGSASERNYVPPCA